jgi:uncharacterized alpha-E superfamily protein
MDDMPRDLGWRFLILGRRLERLTSRCAAVARFLDACDGRPRDIEGLLDLADSAETYRQRYLRSPDIVPTLDLVVFDPQNPHSVVFQCDMLLRYLEAMPRHFAAPLAAGPDLAAFRAATAAVGRFSLAELERGRLDGPGCGRVCTHCGGCTELASRLRLLHDAAGELSNRLAARYFTHVDGATRTVSA